MDLFLKVLSWLFGVSVVLTLFAWLYEKSDLQTFWVFVALWLMAKGLDFTNKEINGKLNKIQETLDAINNR